MATQFRHIMLMVKDVASAVKFFHEGLGLPVTVQSPGWAEIEADGATIAFHGANEAPETGSSPILSFTVDDVHQAIATLESLGGTLEGRVREPSFGTVAAVRSPQGHLVSLLQPKAKSAA